MENFKTRTSMLLTDEGMKKLEMARVAVLGLGGVGGAAVESLCRCGVGNLLLVDADVVKESNINRQLIALKATVGMKKTECWEQRLLSINPDVSVSLITDFILPENAEAIFEFKPDYIIDAIDTVTTKLYIAEQCHKRGVKLIASMGTGGRLDPTKITTGDIKDTKGGFCTLARVIRKELLKRGIDKLDVVYSTEQSLKLTVGEENGRHPPTSSPFVPPTAGYALSSKVVREIIKG